MSVTVPALSLACSAALVLLSVPAVADQPASLVHASGTLISYDPSRIPTDGRAMVTAVATGSGKTIVKLTVFGLLPNTEYGAHAHVHPCGATGLAAGPHYQYVQDPVTPSTNPAYANPANEIWLDMTTNAAGQGHAMAVLDWQFPISRAPGSIILHAEHTHTGPSDSGVAGARLGCLTVPF